MFPGSMLTSWSNLTPLHPAAKRFGVLRLAIG